MRRHRQKLGGFTLIELAMTIILMSLISVVVGKILLQSYQTFLTSQKISESDWQGVMALERMVNDIHTLRSKNDITVMDANQLSMVNINDAAVQYQLTGQSLMRNGFTLATNVQSLSLAYFNQSGAVTGTASAVRYISLSMTMVQDDLTLSFSTLAATRVMS